MKHVRKVFSKAIKEIELIDERYTVLLIGDFKETTEDSKLYIIHDEATDELTYKIVPVSEKIDFEQLLKNLYVVNSPNFSCVLPKQFKKLTIIDYIFCFFSIFFNSRLSLNEVIQLSLSYILYSIYACILIKWTLFLIYY